MSNRIQEYKLIIASEPKELEETVNEHLKRGFELYGDPGTQLSNDGTCQFFQAAVLRGDF